MKLLDFHEQALKSEEHAVSFLQSFGIFDPSAVFCPGKHGEICGNKMSQIRKKSKKGDIIPSWRCSKKLCRVTRSIRSTNRFFTYRDIKNRARCNLSLKEILLIVYHFVYSQDTMEQLMVKTGHGKHTIVDWMNMCREVCSFAINSRPKMVGTSDQPVQIDESYFQGRRKYNRGRLLLGDKKAAMAQEKESGAKDDDADDDESKGPWVFGLYERKDSIRFYLVENRKSSTLIPLILDNVKSGSTIVSDEWAAYKQIPKHGFVHETVNHKKNYVNPETGFHTQAIERAWLEGKKWFSRARSAGPHLQSHLDLICWRAYRRNNPNGLLGAFLEDVRDYYAVEME